MSVSTMARPDLEVRILGFRARVAGPEPILATLRSVLPMTPDWALVGEVTASTSFVVEEAGPTGGRFDVSRHGMPIWSTDRQADVAPYLEWVINDAAVQNLADHYLVHAGAVGIGSQGVILPADSGSGKTTLVAALLAAGARYFSDEVAALDPATGHLLPFAKSLYIRKGSRGVLRSSFPELDAAPTNRLNGESAWYLPPRREWLPPAPALVRHAIVPRYLAGARTEIVRLPRSALLGHLLAQSFNLRRHGTRGIAGLVKILQGVECYTLTSGNAHEAAAAVLALVAAHDS